jgi:hypothetical protein
MKILLGYFNVKLGREDNFKFTTGNDSLHQDSNDNGVKKVNFTTSKNLVVKSTMFLHQNISMPGALLMERLTIRLIIEVGIQVYSMYRLSAKLTVMLITIWWLQNLGKDWW